jgi:AraC-like DNA-binding protein
MRRDGVKTKQETGIGSGTSISTDDVPVADRLAYFREALLGKMVPSEVYSDPSSTFSARMKIDTLGTITLTRLVGRTPSHRGLRRTPDLIRQTDTRGYSLVLYRRGSSVLDHNHHRVAFTPGDMSLIDTSSPYDGAYDRGPSESLSLHFPRELLPLPASAVDRLRGARLCGRAGVGALLWMSATRVARDIDRFHPTDAIRVSTTLLDLVAAVLAHELEATNALPAESHRRTLFHQIQAFIEQRLGDPALTPAAIAAVHHISPRTLHRLFEPHGSTVAEWIRLRRLDRCRRDLADPSLTGTPVHAIATRWGLPSAAHFSRIFRTTYGLSPQDYRSQANPWNADADSVP